jgi:hypothetical protein
MAVPEEVRDVYLRRAEKVREALDLAGIPTHRAEDFVTPAGAQISLDFVEDQMGGVFVTWRPSDTLDGAILSAAEKGLPDDPMLEFSMIIIKYMRDAIFGILQVSGFEVSAIDESDLMPPAVHVRGGPIG